MGTLYSSKAEPAQGFPCAGVHNGTDGGSRWHDANPPAFLTRFWASFCLELIPERPSLGGKPSPPCLITGSVAGPFADRRHQADNAFSISRLLRKDPLDDRFRLIRRDVGLSWHRQLSPLATPALDDPFDQHGGRGWIIGISGCNGLEGRAKHFPFEMMACTAILGSGQFRAGRSRARHEYSVEHDYDATSTNHGFFSRCVDNDTNGLLI